jgi:hypothetical protein
MRLALRADEAENAKTIQVHAAVLIGLSLAIKLTNVVAAAPLVMVFAYKAVFGKRRLAPRQLITTTVLAFIALVAPILPFSIYLWRLTGNPVFPLANKIFKSPYWPVMGGWDARWGPTGFGDTLFWPILIWFRPERHSELAVYSGRISIGAIVAVVALPLVWRHEQARLLCIILLLGCFLWSVAGLGYSRYGLNLEILSGIVIIAAASVVMSKSAGQSAWWRRGLAAFLVLALGVQCAIAVSLISRYEWSMRPIVFQDGWGQNAQFLLRDRSLPKFLTPEDQALVSGVDVWVESSVKTTAFQAFLKPNAPVIGVRNPEFLQTPPARRRFIEVLHALEDRRLFTLTDTANIESARKVLSAAGLVAGETHPIALRYFSREPTFELLLVKVTPVWQTGAAKGPAPKGQPLPFSAFDAGLSVAQPPRSVRRGEMFVLKVTLTNLSQIVWPGQQPEWKYQVTVTNIWLSEDGHRLSDLEKRAVLTRDLAPGESVELPLTVIAPDAPGNYTLKLDAVQESVAWFSDMGSRVLDLQIQVQ